MKAFKNIFTNEEGSVLPLVGAAMFVLVGATGVAVDVGRLELAQSRLQNAVDTAGLAAGAAASTANVEDKFNEYFDANFNEADLGVAVTDKTVTENINNSVLTFNVTGTVDTTFMGVFGYQSMDVSAYTEVTRATKGLELAMVLDVTGSMEGQKLQDLKDASNDLLDILFGDDATQENLWVGIVPFSFAVNIGSTNTTWIVSKPSKWKGCVKARYTTGRDVTDDHYTTEKFTAYKPSDCPNAITKLTNTKSTLVSAISALDAAGATHINVGAVWGWRLISPTWQNKWGGSMDTNGLPLAYKTDLMTKAVIIMTDGDNYITDSTDGAYGPLYQGNLGTTDRSDAEDELDSRLLEVCSALKEEDRGVIVYTVGFQVSEEAEALLEQCASNEDFFFNADSGAELSTAFKKIGDSLANLRISR